MKKLIYHLSRLLCYALSLMMTLLLCFATVTFAVNITLGSSEFMNRCFTRSEVITSLNSDLNKNFENLSEETNIPCSVFVDAAGYDFIGSVQPTVVKSIYSAAKTDFSSTTDLKNKYEKAINKYDEKSGVIRSADDTEKIADKAVEIFNRTCSIKNNTQFGPFTKYMGTKMFIVAFAAFLCFAILISAEYLMNGKRRKSFNFIAMAVMSCGEILVVITAIAFFSGTFHTAEVTNIGAYNTAISYAVLTMMAIIFAAGILFILTAAAIFISNFKYYKQKLIDCDTESEISRNIK